MITTHRLSPELFSAFSAGHGDTAGISFLRRARHSTLLLTLTHVLRLHARSGAAVDLLCHMDHQAPAETAEVLLYPWVGAWLTGLVDRRWSADDDDYLTGIGLAAALRAGEPLPRRIRTTGRLGLPSVGASAGPVDGPAEDVVSGYGWLSLRPAAPGIALDDLDSGRSCFGLPVTGRLDDRAVGRWRDRMTRALELIAEHAPVRHRELAAGLRAITPLAAGAHGRSATHRYAFGGLATALPGTAEELAATLIHEFQHSKLNAMMDVVRLYEPCTPERYFAPWRADPRPIGGLLHGAYAFAAVGEFWDAIRTVPAMERQATIHAARFRGEVVRALRELRGAPALTTTGRGFVAGLAAGITDRGRPIPADVARRAARRLARTEQTWLQRNNRLDGTLHTAS